MFVLFFCIALTTVPKSAIIALQMPTGTKRGKERVMKKSIFRFIILTLTLVLMTGLAIGLSSCANLIESLLGSVTGTETSQQEQTTTTEPTTHTHTIVIDKAVEATATEDGLTEGKHCSACGEILVKQEVLPALGSSGLAYEVHLHK